MREGDGATQTIDGLTFTWIPAACFTHGRRAPLTGIILHSSDGHLEGDIATLTGAGSQVSSHWYVLKGILMKRFAIIGLVAVALALVLAPIRAPAAAKGQISYASFQVSGIVDLGSGELVYITGSGYQLAKAGTWSGTLAVAVARNGTITSRYQSSVSSVTFATDSAHVSGNLPGGKTLTEDLQGGLLPAAAGYEAGGSSEAPVPLAFKTGLVRLRPGSIIEHVQ